MHLFSPVQLKEAYAQGFVVPVTLALPNWIEPEVIYQAFRCDIPSVLLESPSVLPDRLTHRFSYICWDPLLTVRIKGGSVEYTDRANHKTTTPVGSPDPLDILRDALKPFRGKKWKGVNFFTGGAIGCFGYELAGQFERLPPRHQTDDAPDVFFSVYDRLAVADHRTGRVLLIQNIWPENGVSFEQVYRRANDLLHTFREKLETYGRKEHHESFRIRHLTAGTDSESFYAMVQKAKRYIAQGDIYQANISQCFRFGYEGDAFELYRRLQRINPSPFAAFADFGAWVIVSSSPERLVRLRGDICETRPIAGTRPRGSNDRERERLRADLLLNEKERAEHLMLVDLERNDLGRVSEAGSVCVNEWMTVETYSHVQHIVSNVAGLLRPDRDRFDLFKAMFPGGTITGCPKIRCMEIIHELEREDRGFYTGSLGFFDFNGDMDINILIRTLILNEGKGSFRVGAGIVADSREDYEFQETLHKAGALFEALGVSRDRWVKDHVCAGI